MTQAANGFLRTYRLRISLWTAVIEGLLVVTHTISPWVVYVLAVVAVVFWVSAGRAYKSATARQAAWIFTASQAIAVLVPIFLFVAKIIAIFAIALMAVVALIFLFAERDHS